MRFEPAWQVRFQLHRFYVRFVEIEDGLAALTYKVMMRP